jgi:hypothetical protein
MVKLTKSIELTLSDILKAIDLLPPQERNIVAKYLIDEKTGIKLTRYADMPKTLDLKQMMLERGYKGVDWQKVDAIVAEMDIQDPVEELLKQLTP